MESTDRIRFGSYIKAQLQKSGTLIELFNSNEPKALAIEKEIEERNTLPKNETPDAKTVYNLLRGITKDSSERTLNFTAKFFNIEPCDIDDFCRAWRHGQITEQDLIFRINNNEECQTDIEDAQISNSVSTSKSNYKKDIQKVKYINNSYIYYLLGAIVLIASIYLIRPILIHDEFNCHFFDKKQSKFKILILPFEVIGEKNNNRDLGSEFNERLQILNQKDSLNTYSFYHEVSISKNFDSDSAYYYLDNCNADLIIYGTFKEVYSLTDSVEINYNWILSDKYKLDTFQLETLINPQKSRIQSLRKGHLQGGTDYIIYFTNALSTYYQGKYQKTLTLTNYISDSLKILSGEVSLIRGNSFSNLGYYKQALSEYEVGIEHCNKQNETYLILLSNISVTNINKLGKVDAKYFNDQVYAIEKLKEINASQYVNQGFINLISSQIEIGKYKEAIESSYRFKEYYTKHKETSPSQKFSYYRQQGIAYEKLLDYQNATKNYREALRIAKKEIPKLVGLATKDLIICNQEFGLFNQVEEIKLEFKEYLKRLENFQENILNEPPLNRLDSLKIVSNLLIQGKSLSGKGEYKKGLELFENAELIQLRANPYDKLTLASCRNHIAICLEYNGQYDDACILYEENNQNLIEVLGKDNPKTYAYRVHEYNLKLLHAQNMNQRNLRYFQKISKKDPSNKNKEYIVMVNSRNRPKETLEIASKRLLQTDLIIFDTIIDFYKNYYGKSNLSIGNLYRISAIANESVDSFGKTNHYFQEAFHVFEDNSFENMTLARLYTDYAIFLMTMNKKGNSKKIVSNLDKSLALKKELLGIHNQQLLITYYNLILINDHLKEYDRINRLIEETKKVHVYDTTNHFFIEINQFISKYNVVPMLYPNKKADL